MNRHPVAWTVSLSTIAFCLCAAPAFGQQAAQPPQAEQAVDSGDVVTVTGTLLAGSGETGALPVQVFSDTELEKRGDPSPLELVKSIPAVGATLGDSNRFPGQNAGSISVNLRNMGADKTLVLFNGKRMPTSQLVETGGVDAAYIPSASTGRIEVLLDGASTTYGSDAMAGVVNFISKAGFDGFEVEGSYDWIDGSNGDYKTNFTFGRAGDWGNLLLTAGYYHRSELQSNERDWTSRPFDLDPQNGWSIGALGSYQILSSLAAPANATTGRFVDPGCVANGGLLVNGAIKGAGVGCRYHNAHWTNLADDTDGFGLYGEINVDLPAEQKFHLDAFYSGHDVPHDVQEPAYTPSSRFPLSTGFGGNNPVAPRPGLDSAPGFYIPGNHPGLQTLIALNPGVFTQAEINSINANGLLTVSGAWRPYAYGGNVLTDGPQRSSRQGWAWRIAGGFKGPLAFGIDYNADLTYGQTIFDRSTMEFTTENLQYALRGLGGFGCTPGGSNPATSTPGQGPCLWFNPFSTGEQVNRQIGQANTVFEQAFLLNPQVANTTEVARYIQEIPYAFRDESRFTTIDLGLQGKLPITFWSGEEMAWAVGTTYMWTQDIKEVPPATALESAPCPTPGVTTCINKTGPLTFFGALPPYDTTTDRVAVFGELFMPITQSLEATVAIRHEDLGDFGTTTDPKLNLRWQATDWLALRGSASSTFKAPYPTRFVGGIASGFNAAQLNAFVNTLPINGQTLEPEKADNYSAGAILDVGGFTATLDYYNIKLKGVIEADAAASMLTAFFGPAGSTTNARCSADASNPYYALQQRFQFTGGRGDPSTCALANLQAIYVGSSNSQDYDISGIDFLARYTFPDVLGGDLNFGLDYNYVIEFIGSGSSVEGIALGSGGATDYAGTLGGGGFAALPRSKGNVYAEWASGPHNLRLTYHYIEGMEDISPAIFPANATNLFGKYMDDWTPVDLTYRLELPSEVKLSLGVINIFDRDPPVQRQALAYNTHTANPLGRIFRVGLSKAF